MKKQKKLPELSEEWDISQGMGILPEEVPFTQNIGCVGGKTKKPETKKSKNNK